MRSTSAAITAKIRYTVSAAVAIAVSEDGTAEAAN
jgi:hypothetical protein